MKKDEEEISEEALEIMKKKDKVLDWLWSPEEKRTVLGLLKGRKMKNKKEKNV